MGTQTRGTNIIAKSVSLKNINENQIFSMWFHQEDVITAEKNLMQKMNSPRTPWNKGKKGLWTQKAWNKGKVSGIRHKQGESFRQVWDKLYGLKPIVIKED